MNWQERWERAVKKTEIVRPRILPLQTYESTRLPYICLSESSVNAGDTAVRRGEIIVQRPSIVMPFNTPQFEGFELEEKLDMNQDLFTNFMLVRGVQFPAMKFNNRGHSLDVFEGGLSKAISHFKSELQKAENVHSALVACPEDCWQFSVLLFVCSQVSRSAENDLRRLMDDMRRFDHN